MDGIYTRINWDYENNAETFGYSIQNTPIPEEFGPIVDGLLQKNCVYVEPELASRFESWVSELPGYADGPAHARTALLFYENEELDEDEIEDDGHAKYPVIAPSVKTKSGRFVVFNLFNAGCPEIFLNRGGDWFFEPVDYQDNNVFSAGYSTRVAALKAAEEWEAQQEWEAGKTK